MEKAKSGVGTAVVQQDTYSEAWRHECEARSILAIATPAARRHRLVQIERARGAGTREKLEHTVRVMQEKQITAGRAALMHMKSLVTHKT